ncbi:TPA: helix-turn-helix transcriptional regulator [Escherichia coli]|uniref:helix-turn-helix domain-containing protein n=1 Tax=Escherichia coli TaxID=562 RepID=UPI000C282483|nr:helix-turn-helix transcriptional regulator [Escherichia coli]EFE7550139.1 helix-turn-helix transcriptional regulator [Escherichia coli]EGL0709162.1 helix-turn-helix transcriptional regulator [Escherichia coli]EGM5994357.1 helix-turn-helix transcriptional regulator [Escherichia coli]EJD4428961.1 helix-turn-helix transcriptional regulator [Escherichia coli]MCW9904099.1 helix-turn-helix domain-containing protein [Escherichia coli]
MTSIKHDRTFHNEQIVRFGERLEKAMGGLNKSEIARRSGLSEASVRKYLRGDSYPTIDSAARVADACGVSLMWLLTGEQPQGDDSNNYENTEPKFDCDDDSVALIVSLLGFVSSKDRKALAIAASEIGVKGILNRLATSVETDIETVIRNLNIRDSLKEAICVALAGNEETDKEILQRAKSCIRAGTPGDRVPVTPEQETKPVNKKSA